MKEASACPHDHAWWYVTTRDEETIVWARLWYEARELGCALLAASPMDCKAYPLDLDVRSHRAIFSRLSQP